MIASWRGLAVAAVLPVGGMIPTWVLLGDGGAAEVHVVARARDSSGMVGGRHAPTWALIGFVMWWQWRRTR